VRDRYVLIAPCRNEEKYVRRTLDSIASQSIPPQLLVVVDDGSTDSTPAILAEYTATHRWIRVVKRTDRGARSVGPGVIESFYDGLATVDLAEYEFVCKLDLDLELPARYFEHLIKRMRANPRLGTCSGKPYYYNTDGALVPEVCGDEMSVGMTKFYRTDCFRQIGGFVREVMWDGIDCHLCRRLGWTACSLDAPELRFLHLRPMGSSQGNIWKGRKRHGFGQYFMGTGLLFMTASSVYRIPRHPFLVGSLAMYVGYLESLFKRAPRYGDVGFRRFLRRYQLESLLLGKRRAAARAEARSAHLFQPQRPSGDLPTSLPTPRIEPARIPGPRTLPTETLGTQR
jgi:poly-beta-1,6-N-acetyl-D-glucosamine synthase